MIRIISEDMRGTKPQWICTVTHHFLLGILFFPTPFFVRHSPQFPFFKKWLPFTLGWRAS